MYAQKMKQRHDQMLEIRKHVAELVSSTSSYSGVLFQTATMLAQQRDELAERKKKDASAELEISKSYLDRLGTAFFGYFDEVQSRSITLMGVSDIRVADQSNLLHLLVVDVQNETGNMFEGSVVVTPERAKEIQNLINTQESILLTMVSPRKWERHFNFRSSRRASRAMTKDGEKVRRQVEAAKSAVGD